MKFIAQFIGILFAALLSSTPASATVIYKFDFTNLMNVQSGTGADFSIVLTYSDYVQSTGMAAIPGPAQATTLGYSVLYAGANNKGWWGFDDDTSASISDATYYYGGLSFLFSMMFPQPDYLSTPGVYAGYIGGNAPSAFSGSALLTITDTSAVPEPGTLALVGLALAGLAASRRRMR